MVKVNYGALQTMSSTTSSASQARVAGYKQLINAFSTFSGSYELQGDGYDAARTYASGIMVSYYQACILYSEAVADAADYLADTYTALCGSESLDEEELQTEINNATRGSMQVSSSIASFERRDKLTDSQKASLESLRKQASELDEQIRVATEKLEHLRAFDTASASACTAANDAAATIASAEHTLGVSFAAKTFECTTSTDWATTVATKWEARAVNLQESYDKALQKLYNGEELTESDLTAIERYNSEYPGVVDQEILQYTKEVRSLKAEEMRYRVVVDKVIEGKQLTSDERKFAKEFAAKYPDLEINKVILSTVERQENYKKIIEKANKGKELNAGELDFLINYYKDYPDVSVPKSVSKSLKNRKFENKISQSSLANLEESYGYAVKDYERYLNTGQYVYTKGGVTLQEAAYIYRVYNLKKSSGEDTLQERTDKKKMFANLRASDKKKIDSKTLAELSSEHIEFMTGRTSIEFDYIIGSDADKAKKDYEYYRFNELMKKQPIDWRDPDYMNKRNQYILKTGKNPSTGEKATKDEIFVAKNYGWVKGTTDVATATIDLLDNLGIFQLAMTKISRPKIDTSKIVKEINISDTATVPNTHTDVKIPKLKPAKTVDLEVPVKPKVDVKVPKIKPVEAVAGTTTMVPKSKKPDIDVLTKPKDLSTIKGEAVDHVGTVKPKVELDVPEVKDVHDVEAPKYNKEQILKNLEESKLARESSGFKDFSTRERYIEKVFNKLSPAERELIFNISKNAPKVEYRPGNTAKSVLSIPKNDRPNIEKVYSSEYIEAHRQQFENGAIKFQKFTPEEGGYNNGAIGNPKDHVAFVMPKEAGETLIKVTKGDPELLEDILGLHRGDLGSSPVAIEIPPESIKNLRIPSGNEDSAFDGFWKPGGQTFPGNMPEAVIDEVPWGEFTIRKLGGD
ncbi:hypothetical protein [Streptococcus parasanguinis]|jgi:hypothetical protein|uniref:hypothetical protein n=1 Tax=Streptococcus parasanguinis TaxID=1318 RepID=UPI000B15A162|nr:hypothetical protein [Streptococcus parasanguinis]